MSETVAKVATYLCRHYPVPTHLSKARLTKLVYLADWRASLQAGHQITPIEWQFNHYGPYVDDVIDVVRANPDVFEIERTQTMYGTPKALVRLREDGPGATVDLAASAIEALDFVIDSSKSKNFTDFIRLVYSTYPVTSQPQYATFNLSVLAKEYALLVQAPKMVEWFQTEYKDPAEGVPHNSREGGYQYTNGGPYEAAEVLAGQFPEVSALAHEAACDQLAGLSTEWVGRDQY
jgi:hypothetical protein